MKVQNNEVTFCVNSAEWPEEIDEARAMNAKQRAEERLKNNAAIKILLFINIPPLQSNYCQE